MIDYQNFQIQNIKVINTTPSHLAYWTRHTCRFQLSHDLSPPTIGCDKTRLLQAWWKSNWSRSWRMVKTNRSFLITSIHFNRGLRRQRFWLDLCTKQVVTAVLERAHTSLCPQGCIGPITGQVLHYLAWELCRQIAAFNLSSLTPFLLVWGVRNGALGGRWSFWAGGPKFILDC